MADAGGGPAGAGRVSTAPQERRPGEQTAWVGWVVFGAAIMVLLGVFHLLAGFVALFNENHFEVASRDLVVSADYVAWGWVHLLGGLVLLGTGVGLLTGAAWARVAGVGVAMVSAVLNLLFLAAAPVWSTVMIALGVVVVYAISVHGDEVRNAA